MRPSLSSSASRPQWSTFAGTSKRLGHGQNDSVSKAFLQEWCLTKDREHGRKVFHVPRLPLAVLRRKQRGQADLEVGVETMSNLSHFSDRNAVEPPELISGPQCVGLVMVYARAEDPCTCLHQCRTGKQDIRPGHFR
jgi:hypothetical protein